MEITHVISQATFTDLKTNEVLLEFKYGQWIIHQSKDDGEEDE